MEVNHRFSRCQRAHRESISKNALHRLARIALYHPFHGMEQ